MTKRTIQLSEHFTYSKIFRFTIPSIISMLFTSIYGVVDGLFISNVVGETAFAAVNLIYPYCLFFVAFGSIFGVGGSALIGMVRGQGKEEEANRIFTLLVITLAVLGAVFGLIAELFVPAVTDVLGANAAMRDDCILYGRIFLSTLPAFTLQYGFQTLMVAAERPKVGLWITVAAGCTNMVLDWLFIAVLGWGVAGAAAATCIGQVVGGITPVLYFVRNRDLPLKFVKPVWMPAALAKSAGNGLAEGIANASMSVTGVLFNWQLMRMLGEYGVSAYGVLLYVGFVVMAVFLGYTMGICPAISFHYGTGKKEELQSLVRKSLVIIFGSSAILGLLSLVFSEQVIGIFADGDATFLRIGMRALQLYALCFFFQGFNIFMEGMFAALNNGFVAGILSGLRLFVFQILTLLVLPLIWGVDGIWLSTGVAEAIVALLTVIVMIRENRKYQYWPRRRDTGL